MGWNLCIASETARTYALQMDRLIEHMPGDPDQKFFDLQDAFDEGITSLSKGFSSSFYGVLEDAFTELEVDSIQPDSIEVPEQWTPHDPKQLLALLTQV